MNSLIAIFIFSVILIIYIYIGYPALVCILAKLFGKKVAIDGSFKPTVTVIISAFNEEKSIGEKIENTLGINYPSDKLEIIVASDASSDKTDDTVRNYEKRGVLLITLEGRAGKTVGQNEAVKMAKGEIIIFTDSKTIFEKDTVAMLVSNFSDKTIGTVGGRIIYKNDKNQIKEGAYIKYEQAIREWESTLLGSTSTAGALYAIRRTDYVPLPKFAQSDFIEPISIFIKTGRKPIHDKRAICSNISAGTSGGEFRRHERIITRYLFSRKLVKGAYNPFLMKWYSVELVSHKSLRFYSPYFLIGLLLINILLWNSGSVWMFLLIMQLSIYVFAFVGYLLDKNGKGFLLFSIPYHFAILNLAALKAWVNYARGKNFVIWKNKSA